MEILHIMLFFYSFSVYYKVVATYKCAKFIAMACIKAVFGTNIKYYRKKQELTQEQLAEKLGITPKHLSTIETGANFVSAELLEKFTRHFLISASALFYSVEEISVDDNILSQIDRVIDDECSKLSSSIKTQIRHLHNQP